MNLQTKKYFGALALLIIIAGMGGAHSAKAESDDAPVKTGMSTGLHLGERMRGEDKGMGVRPAAVGTVTAVNGSTLTVSAVNPKDSTTTVYTVDASNAKVTKDHAASTPTAIAVGDQVMIVGTTNGTTITATHVFNDKMMSGKGMDRKEMQMTTEMPAGNGQPVIMGTVSAVNGTSLTVTNKAGATYAVDAATTKFTKVGVEPTATITNIAIGDTVIVQGAVNGSAVVASSVIDQGAKPSAPVKTESVTSEAKGPEKGFFGKIGNFFGRLFGF